MDTSEIMARLDELSNPDVAEFKRKRGIHSPKMLGVTIGELRAFAKNISKNHALALRLFDTGVHEARILSSLIDIPNEVTSDQMDYQSSCFDSWAICDAFCSNLFYKTKFAYDKAIEWSNRKEEYTKRAGFTLMVNLSLHMKEWADSRIETFLPVIIRECRDERLYVKKAVNWALREIGKRNLSLNQTAIKTAEAIKSIDTPSAQWIAADALRELNKNNLPYRIKIRSNA